MKVFSRKKFIEVEGIDEYNVHKFWVNLCNNREVIDGKIVINEKLYYISDIWCIDKSYKPLSIKFNKCYEITVLTDREKYHLKNMPAQKFVELVLNAIDNKSFDAISQLYNFVMKNFLITDFILKSEIK